MSKEELLQIAAHAEYYSNHPIAKSIIAAYPEKIKPESIGNPIEISGQGIEVNYQGQKILAGNKKLMSENKIDLPIVEEIGSVVYFAKEDKFIGYICIDDLLKENTKKTIQDLKKIGINQTIMLTGDRQPVAKKIAESVSIDDYYAELLPQDKVEQLQRIIHANKKGLVAYVGDGINDAPVLALADVGIAMGGLGSAAAVEAADIVIMQDQLERIVDAIKVGRKTLGIAKQNLIIALSIKTIILILATFGFANLWLAVFGDVGVTIIAVFNALRALLVEKK